ncbi:MAG: SNF2-related protein [Peptostreptococcaceae bacterium]
MTINTIEEIIKNKSDRSKYNSGFISHKRNLVFNNYAKIENNVATFYGSVRGEGYESTNTSMVTIDIKNRVLLNLSCDCDQSMSPSSKAQICHHMVAVVLQGLDSLKTATPKAEQEKVINSDVTIEVTQVSDDYIGIDLSFGGIDKSENKNIFNSFRENKRMHRLKNGNYLNLKEDKISKALELIEGLGINDNINNIKVHNSKAMFIDFILEDEDYDFIKCDNYIKNIKEKYKKITKEYYEVPKELNANLRDYQVKGYRFLRTLSEFGFGGILADEMGLGKTIQVITFLLSQTNKKSIIVTPTALIYNWKNELEKFAPTLKVGIVYKDVNTREKIISEFKNYDVILTTYGTLKNDLNKYQNIDFDFCIIDEAQNIKNPASTNSTVVKSINAKVKFALTGTPMENNLLELWSIFDFVMPGYLYDKAKFQGVFRNGERNMQVLKNMISPFMLRRTKKQVVKELPDKIEQKLFVELGAEHKKVYNAYIKVIKNKIKELNLDKITVFSYLTKLRQLCLVPNLMVKNYKGKNSKLSVTLNILEESKDKKVLIFSQFTGVLQEISKELDKKNISHSYLDGKTKAVDRVKLVDEFNESKEKRVFLISLKAGGTGLNLTSASVVIHFDPWWNPAVEAQATDRAHRIGQKEVVNVIKLVAKDTVEERVIGLQESKKELIDDIIDGNLENSNTLKGLSSEEIIDLFIK